MIESVGRPGQDREGRPPPGLPPLTSKYQPAVDLVVDDAVIGIERPFARSDLVELGCRQGQADPLEELLGELDLVDVDQKSVIVSTLVRPGMKALSKTNLSGPEPPVRLSLSSPPFNLSLPSPPVSASAPAPPLR